METERYKKWIESKRSDIHPIDVAESVMDGIAKKPRPANTLKPTLENMLFELMRAKALARTCVLISGAIVGAARMIFQMYSILFV